MGVHKLIITIFLLINICVSLEAEKDLVPHHEVETWKWVFEKLSEAHLSSLAGFSIDKNQTCTLCHLLTDALLFEKSNHMTKIQLEAEVDYFCSIALPYTDRVCEGIIRPNLDVLEYIVDNRPKLNGQKICALILQSVGCESEGSFDWTIDIPSGKTIDKSKPSGSTTLKILQLSDIHYDPNYTEKKKSKCDEPVCCQNDQLDASDGNATCGHWGSYSNDVPLQTIEATLQQTNAAHDLDYVYFTGDLVSHRVWSTSVENNKKIISEIIDKFSNTYKVPVYPILGNHEAHPVNIYSPIGINDTSISIQWLYDLILEKWATWLPEEEVKDTLLKGGYYTVLAKKGFRVVVLNSNVCQTMNWWLLYEDEDPSGQLKWLVDVLQKAEANNETVHILTHIPTRSCLKVWTREYKKIIERFSNTIAAQFYGHTHRDEFYVYYDSESKPINVGWNGASLMPDDSNPNYKIYTVDAGTFDILDAESWTFNLTSANEKNSIEWYKLYSFKKDFEVESLQPEDLDKLVRKMVKNDTLTDIYIKYQYRNSEYADNCDDSCRSRALCNIVNTESGDDQICEDIKK